MKLQGAELQLKLIDSILNVLNETVLQLMFLIKKLHYECCRDMVN